MSHLRLSQLIALLVLLGIIARVSVYAVGAPIWGDEAFVATNFALRDFAGMIKPLVYGQIVPLVYMWATLMVTHVLGLSEWALRLVSFLSGIAALGLFVSFARRTLPRGAALLAIGFFASSYYVIRHTAEVKPYATDCLVSLVIIMLTYRVLRAPSRLSSWWMLIIACALAPWCSYPAIFVIGAAILSVLMRICDQSRANSDQSRARKEAVPPNAALKNRSLTVAALFGGLVLTSIASAAAMYIVIAKPHAAYAAQLMTTWKQSFPPWHPLNLILWLFNMHTGPMFAYPQGGKPPGSIITFALFVIGCLAAWRTKRSMFWLLLLPFVLNLAAAAVHAYPYGDPERVTHYLAPAICWLAGLGLHSVFQRTIDPRRRPLARRVAVAVFAVFAVATTVESVIKPYKDKNVVRSRAAVREIAAQTRQNDRWVLFNADRPVPYAPYLGDWGGIGSVFVFDVLRYAPVPLQWSPPPDEVTATRDGSVWLLVYQVKHPKAEFPQALLDEYVSRLSSRLGQPEVITYPVKAEKDKTESIMSYQFSRSE